MPASPQGRRTALHHDQIGRAAIVALLGMVEIRREQPAPGTWFTCDGRARICQQTPADGSRQPRPKLQDAEPVQQSHQARVSSRRG